MYSSILQRGVPRSKTVLLKEYQGVWTGTEGAPQTPPYSIEGVKMYSSILQRRSTEE